MIGCCRVDDGALLHHVAAAHIHPIQFVPADRLQPDLKSYVPEPDPADGTTVNLLSARLSCDRKRNVVPHFKAMLRLGGLPNIRFHDLRHSCATMNIYSHAIPEVNRAAANALGQLLTPQVLELPTKTSPRSGTNRRGDEG